MHDSGSTWVIFSLRMTELNQSPQDGIATICFCRLNSPQSDGHWPHFNLFNQSCLILHLEFREINSQPASYLSMPFSGIAGGTLAEFVVLHATRPPNLALDCISCPLLRDTIIGSFSSQTWLNVQKPCQKYFGHHRPFSFSLTWPVLSPLAPTQHFQEQLVRFCD